MHNVLLFNADGRPFDFATVKRVFQSEHGFRDVRFNEPGCDVIEADYVAANGATIVGLSGDRETISLSGTSDAALSAAIILQRHVDMPLRMVDTEYSFDLTFHDISTVEELHAAIERARTY